jgi:HEXXH motif-containing protein
MATGLPHGFLALPSDADVTLRRLTRKLRLLALRRLLITEPGVHGAAFRRVRAFVEQLAREKTTAAPLLAALGDIDVLAPLLCLESGQADGPSVIADTIPSLLVGLSRRLPERTMREVLLWDRPTRRVIDDGKLYRFDEPARGLLVDGAKVEVRLADGRDVEWPPSDGEVADHRLFPQAPRPALGLIDSNPLSMLEAHPSKQGNAVDLGEHDADAWRTALREACHLIALGLPGLFREIHAHLQRVVPVGYDAEKHLSASYLEAPGLVYLTLHPSPLTLAEALVHEFQHGKLNTLRWFDSVLENGDSEWTESPVRPDLRPLIGVLMGVHAFVPVAALHAELAAADHPIAQTPVFMQRRTAVLEGNRSGLATLADLARPSANGRRVLDALVALHEATEERLS